MSKNMLIDSAHLEEIRVAVVDGDKLDKFDFISPSKKQIKGNIYLGKIVRVEPSLQAAFVDFGGDRHGFLSFSEIHHDYFQIPIGDREELESRIQEAMSAHAAEDKTDGEEEIDAREISRLRYQFYRRYKIQEVIKKRQIVLVQVTKEERGVKGAALTTYISLAGRYCVFMPNMSKGSGISRKISNPKDRQKMKALVSELDSGNGSTVIRTAGVGHTKLEIKKDFEYLKKLWDEIRNTTLKSTAPCLIYEEANIIKRAIRDLYSRDIESIVVEGESGYKFTKDLVRKLMPSHAKKVKLYDDKTIPLFSKFNVNDQVNQIYSTRVDLPSGGYLVINTTEALVSIDVNSGKSTRARDIAGTAIKTNLEAATEIARQCRLRDLAGLIVVDFIDMEEKRNNTQVERCLREALREDKAKIQVGTISGFGLLEFSRQRLRSSISDANMIICPHCNGTGLIWSDESVALQILRKIEETCMAINLSEVSVTLSPDIAVYILNNKKNFIASIEERGVKIKFMIDTSIGATDFKIGHVTKPITQHDEDSDDDESPKFDAEEKKSNSRKRSPMKKSGSRERTENRRGVGRPNNRRKGEKTANDAIAANVNATEAKSAEESPVSSVVTNLVEAETTAIEEPKAESESRGNKTRRVRQLGRSKNWQNSQKDDDDITNKPRRRRKEQTVFDAPQKKRAKNATEDAKSEADDIASEKPEGTDDALFVYERKDFGNLIETYRELEKSITTPQKTESVLPITEKKSKKSGWWQRLLKPTDDDKNAE